MIAMQLIVRSKNFEDVESEVVFSCHVFEHIVPAVSYFHRIGQETVHELELCFLVPPVKFIIRLLLGCLQFCNVFVLAQSLHLVMVFPLCFGFRFSMKGGH
jgi:hypothetical protein